MPFAVAVVRVTAWAAALTVLSILAVAFSFVIGLSCLWPADHHDDERPLARTHHPRERAVNPLAAQKFLAACTPPTHPLSIAEAHREMQLHRECRCARQRFALQTLIEAGRLRPDSHRERPQSWTL
ncbi:hypothetical protein BJY24_004449 [Nocardia transvalensis]|uniref:Uncharacterized protein n=1 Tax=Nocardia transvalensis TaxID=37333 RepID=A0A7W9PG96_9NOCA|nr:hypothetical protein [Nocardia transvalensis]MBB5915537.1 hypothetical protein [Nocardia transvalensis]